MACDGRCLSDVDTWGMQSCFGCPGKIKKQINKISIPICVLMCVVFICIALSAGMMIGYSTKRTEIINTVESTILKSIEQGRPFLFHNGRIGIIVQKEMASNGKTVAYRAVSFTYPEEDPMIFTPVNKFGKYGWKGLPSK